MRTACLLLLFSFSLGSQTPPTTPKHPVTDTYFDTKVKDDYRWLESQGDPAVKTWVASQNQYSRSYFDSLPQRGAIHADLEATLRHVAVRYSNLQYANGRYFFSRFDPKLQQPVLVSSKSLEDLSDVRVVIDPNQLDPTGHTAIDWYRPSLDGSLVAVALSQGGSELSSLHIFETGTGQQRGEVIPRVNAPTAGGSMVWFPGGRSFLYTRYPQPGERPPADLNFYQQVYEHRIGQPTSSDRYVLGKELPRIAEIVLSSDHSGNTIVASVENGDGGEFAHYLRNQNGSWRQLASFKDGMVSVLPADNGQLYLLSRKNANHGQVLKLAVDAKPSESARLLIPESEQIIQELAAVTNRNLYLTLIDGGPNRLAAYTLNGQTAGFVPLPPISSVNDVAAIQDDQLVLRSQSYLTAPAYYRYGGGTLTKTALATPADASLGHVVVERIFATSKDGTRVPMTVLRRKDMLKNGANGTLLTGYGGYSISLSPSYIGFRPESWWLREGNIYVIANLRGGSEYGEAWHASGNLVHKQNVFDDFLACAQKLIADGYTNHNKLAIMGGSNGGLLMGAALTQRPDLFRAVVSMVGIYDMLRVELDSNGAFNVTEFGSVKDPDQFQALYRYSPYQHVDDGASYPAVLMTTGDNDGRVNPAHSRKMTARLQEATRSGHPILLRTDANAGHGHGSALNVQINQLTDVYSFLFDQLGLHYSASKD